jgi:crotonobetainyl-CoA:carnitine CoA-transferase CaiB-like acyl-CoA transferase
MVVETEHTTLGPVKSLGLPVKFSETPGEVASAAPVYGEHSRAVLAEHGFSTKEIDAFVAEGAVIAV